MVISKSLTLLFDVTLKSYDRVDICEQVGILWCESSSSLNKIHHEFTPNKPLAIRKIGSIKRKRNHSDSNNSFPIPSSPTLLYSHSFFVSSLPNNRLRKYVYICKDACHNMLKHTYIYVCMSDSTYTNIHSKAHKRRHNIILLTKN